MTWCSSSVGSWSSGRGSWRRTEGPDKRTRCSHTRPPAQPTPKAVQRSLQLKLCSICFPEVLCEEVKGCVRTAAPQAVGGIQGPHSVLLGEHTAGPAQAPGDSQGPRICLGKVCRRMGLEMLHQVEPHPAKADACRGCGCEAWGPPESTWCTKVLSLFYT